MRATNENYTIVLIGISDHPPDRVRVPTEKGLCFACQDTLKGKLSIKLADSRGKTIINASSGLAGLEIGGIWPSNKILPNKWSKCPALRCETGCPDSSSIPARCVPDNLGAFGRD